MQKKDKVFGNSSIHMRFIKDYYAAIEKMFNDPLSLASEDISLLKGMCNRCVKHDQGDWRTTFYAIGKPDTAVLKEFVKRALDLRNEIRENNYDSVIGFREDFKEILENMLEHTEQRLGKKKVESSNKAESSEKREAKKTKKIKKTRVKQGTNNNTEEKHKNGKINTSIDVDMSNSTYLLSMYLFNSYLGKNCLKGVDNALCNLFKLSTKNELEDRLESAFDNFELYRKGIFELCGEIYQTGKLVFSYNIAEKIDFDIIGFNNLFFYFVRLNNAGDTYAYLIEGDDTGKKKCNQLLDALSSFSLLHEKFIYSFDAFYIGLTKSYDMNFLKDNMSYYDLNYMDICDCFGTKLFTDLVVKDFQRMIESYLTKRIESKTKRWSWQAKDREQTQKEEPLEIIEKMNEYGCFSVYEALIKHSMIDFATCFSDDYNSGHQYQKVEGYVFVIDLVEHEKELREEALSLMHYYNTYQVYRKIILYTDSVKVDTLVRDVYENGRRIAEKTSLNKKIKYVVIESNNVWYCYLVNYYFRSVILVDVRYDLSDQRVDVCDALSLANNINGKIINGYQVANTKEIFLHNSEHMWKRIFNDLLRNMQEIPGSYITYDWPFLCYAYMIYDQYIVAFPKNSPSIPKKDYRGYEDLDNEFNTQKLLDAYWESSYHEFFGDYDYDYDYEVSQDYDDYDCY